MRASDVIDDVIDDEIVGIRIIVEQLADSFESSIVETFAICVQRTMSSAVDDRSDEGN